ncbi:Pentatricopeptide repeat-containing protein [Thalictrum thalictroides]|uniref:Pentatricopeptide repeat-containing protein n=1 Tax=Thalictrum thalictroides TaxID=46969 RepID=A0A7J6UVJ9_THATH|nr:Pentatricopeptide repeat-containing protein [Thalictrum thalictroides]
MTLQAKEYFEKAAENEEAGGHYNLGVLYLKGIGVKKDVRMARKYFITAANAGQPKAFFQLAKMFHTGIGLKKNLGMATALYKLVAERGPWSSLSRWALESYLKGEVGKAFILYSRMAELGYEIAQSNAAWILDKYGERSMCMGESGFCTDTERHQRAHALWWHASEQGNEHAALLIGDAYYYGRGTERDYDRAAEAYMHARSQSNAQAMFNLGYMHEHGEGVPFDLHLAKRYYDQALENEPAAKLAVTLALMSLWIRTNYADSFWVRLIDSLPELFPKVGAWVGDVVLDEGNATILTLFVCLLTVLYFRDRQRRRAEIALPPHPNEHDIPAPFVGCKRLEVGNWELGLEGNFTELKFNLSDLHLYLNSSGSGHSLSDEGPEYLHHGVMVWGFSFLYHPVAWACKHQTFIFFSKKFNYIKFTNSIIEKVLIELKDPKDAKPALKFFHWSSHKPNTNKIEHGIQSYCLIIHTLVRARFLIEARALLESVVKKSSNDGSSSGFIVVEMLFSSYKSMDSIPLVFDLLIQTYSKLRMFDIAFQACKYIEDNGFSCSLVSFNTLIHVVQKSDRNKLVWKIYEYMIVKRTYPNEGTTKMMISALCKEGKLQKSIDMLDRIHGKRCSPGVIVNSSLVFGILEEGRIDEGIMLMKRMLQKNMIIDDVAYSLIIYAKWKNNNLKSALELYDEMLRRGFRANPFLYTLFINGHCKEGRVEDAKQLMQEMQNMSLKPYDETYNVLIEGCSRAGKLEESLEFCEEMLNEGFLPTFSAFNEMVAKLSARRDVDRANAMLTIMLEKGFIPNEATYSYFMDGYGSEGAIQEVLKLYYEMEYRNHSPGLLAYTSLIRSLCRVGKLMQAEKYLRVMEDRSIAPSEGIYESLISGHCQNGNRIKALQLYNETIKKELKPRSGSFLELVEQNYNAGLQKENKVLDA